MSGHPSSRAVPCVVSGLRLGPATARCSGPRAPQADEDKLLRLEQLRPCAHTCSEESRFQHLTPPSQQPKIATLAFPFHPQTLPGGPIKVVTMEAV
jgi:hypothetical protein